MYFILLIQTNLQSVSMLSLANKLVNLLTNQLASVEQNFLANLVSWEQYYSNVVNWEQYCSNVVLNVLKYQS